MSYAFMTIQKVKSFGTMTSKYNHNCRKVEIDNVDPSLIELNDELVRLPEVDGEEMSYRDAMLKRLGSLEYYRTHDIRSNAVLGYEIVMTYSSDESIDVEEWKKRSVEWLKETFDVAPDGKSNVLHAVCHEDEPGNRHIHAFVVPIDESGKLNAKRFTGGSAAMSKLQSTYAASVSELGLERGIAGTSAKHKDIRRMYSELNRAIEIPNPNPYETALEFRQRVLDFMKDKAAAQEKALQDKERQVRRKLDEERKAQQQAIEEEYHRTIFRAQHEAEVTVNSLKEEKETLTKENDKLKEERDSLNGDIREIEEKLENARLEMNISETEQKFIQEGYHRDEVMAFTEATNPELSKRMQEDMEYAERAYREYVERYEQEEDIGDIH